MRYNIYDNKLKCYHKKKVSLLEAKRFAVGLLAQIVSENVPEFEEHNKKLLQKAKEATSEEDIRWFLNDFDYELEEA